MNVSVKINNITYRETNVIRIKTHLSMCIIWFGLGASTFGMVSCQARWRWHFYKQIYLFIVWKPINMATDIRLCDVLAPSAWIGINDIVTDGRWVLTSSRQRLVYTNWDNGEPNNYRGVREDCGVIVRSGFWNDVTCAPTTLFSSVCEKCESCWPLS